MRLILSLLVCIVFLYSSSSRFSSQSLFAGSMLNLFFFLHKVNNITPRKLSSFFLLLLLLLSNCHSNNISPLMFRRFWAVSYISRLKTIDCSSTLQTFRVRSCSSASRCSISISSFALEIFTAVVFLSCFWMFFCVTARCLNLLTMWFCRLSSMVLAFADNQNREQRIELCIATTLRKKVECYNSTRVEFVFVVCSFVKR